MVIRNFGVFLPSSAVLRAVQSISGEKLSNLSLYELSRDIYSGRPLHSLMFGRRKAYGMPTSGC